MTTQAAPSFLIELINESFPEAFAAHSDCKDAVKSLAEKGKDTSGQYELIQETLPPLIEAVKTCQERLEAQQESLKTSDLGQDGSQRRDLAEILLMNMNIALDEARCALEKARMTVSKANRHVLQNQLASLVHNDEGKKIMQVISDASDEYEQIIKATGRIITIYGTIHEEVNQLEQYRLSLGDSEQQAGDIRLRAEQQLAAQRFSEIVPQTRKMFESFVIRINGIKDLTKQCIELELSEKEMALKISEQLEEILAPCGESLELVETQIREGNAAMA